MNRFSKKFFLVMMVVGFSVSGAGLAVAGGPEGSGSERKGSAEKPDRAAKSERRDQARGKHKGHQKRFKELDLDEAQKAQVSEVVKSAKAERAVILEAHNGDRKAARPELKAHREQTRGKIRALLTAEQQRKWDASRAERKERRGRKDHDKG